MGGDGVGLRSASWWCDYLTARGSGLLMEGLGVMGTQGKHESEGQPLLSEFGLVQLFIMRLLRAT